MHTIGVYEKHNKHVLQIHSNISLYEIIQSFQKSIKIDVIKLTMIAIINIQISYGLV